MEFMVLSSIKEVKRSEINKFLKFINIQLHQENSTGYEPRKQR